MTISSHSAIPRTILVIEDDIDVRESTADMLDLNGFECVLAANGNEGIALAKRDLPAVIITDIEMPGLNGYQLLQAIRGDPALRATPVIMTTAKADRISARRGMDLGADDYITKPFTEDELIRSIRARLDRKELLEELDAFSHTVAHDLKNPLATLMGRLGLLQMTLDTADPATIRRSLRETSAAADRLNTIIDELLLLAGVRCQEVRREPLDMAAVVTEARERLDTLLASSGATLSVGSEWPEVLGHGPWVTHVWMNYLSNAAKYGGPAAQISVGAVRQPDRATARFWVADRGPGLDAPVAAHLFVPFTRISSVRAKGHGLGLSIARRIIEKLDGQVGVESSSGAGARFWFELPLAETQ
jgi:signal transduction histidine kinase